MREIRFHKRVNDILLGPIERPVLAWFARQMPVKVTPDILTVVGIAGAVLIFIGYLLTLVDRNFIWLASAGFVINWFGDSLDGTLARYRNIQRPKYGFFVDHTVDAISIVLIFLGLGLSPYVRFDFACLALIGYLLMAVQIYVTTCVKGIFKLSYGKFGPTELRALAILANAFVFFFGNPALNFAELSISVYDLIGIALAIGLFLVFIITTVRIANELSEVDIHEAQLSQ
jgi:phosphatidylglycerophosphate synthase